MAKAPQVMEESPIKHTSGGEMPDTSNVTEAAQKLRGVAIVMSDRANFLTVVAPFILGGLVIGGIYFFFKSSIRSLTDLG
jgi:hypothetical protein